LDSISFLGCGSWGGALGDVLSRKGIPVIFWHRNPNTVDQIRKTRKHYLVEDLEFSKNVKFTNDISFAINSSRIIVLAIPSQSIRKLLIENNFDNLNAIDWDKGCYVGQEITARMQYRGLLKKKLYALKIKNGDVLEGDELIVDNKKIGTIVSKANSNIFAALNINFVNEIKNKNQNLVINDSLSFDFLN